MYDRNLCLRARKSFSKNLLTDEGKSQLYETTFDVKEVDRLQQLYENSSFQILKEDLFQPNANVIQQMSTSTDKGHQWRRNTSLKNDFSPLKFVIQYLVYQQNSRIMKITWLDNKKKHGNTSLKNNPSPSKYVTQDDRRETKPNQIQIRDPIFRFDSSNSGFMKIIWLDNKNYLTEFYREHFFRIPRPNSKKKELFQPNANVIQQVSTSTDKGHQWHGNTSLKKKKKKKAFPFQIRDPILSLPAEFQIHVISGVSLAKEKRLLICIARNKSFKSYS
ncbi:hypothetical protein CEXT_117111 [Caerostris extrusa]|uniref:Uncharacterized protein n=1 Tax=Caerostris extrusa TaxID=172846 RepID=A0AAV4QJU5_CAEEX|nr:hypothetical protein CEXT_117111 [Caerostris extrusa]